LGLSIVSFEHHKHQFQHIFGTTTVNEKAELQFDISACSGIDTKDFSASHSLLRHFRNDKTSNPAKEARNIC